MEVENTLLGGVLGISNTIGATGASAQVPGCSGMDMAKKGYACCVQVVTKNPGIEQCAKEVAVFRCVGNKNNKYVSRRGCMMPKL